LDKQEVQKWKTNHTSHFLSSEVQILVIITYAHIAEWQCQNVNSNYNQFLCHFWSHYQLPDKVTRRQLN